MPTKRTVTRAEFERLTSDHHRLLTEVLSLRQANIELRTEIRLVFQRLVTLQETLDARCVADASVPIGIAERVRAVIDIGDST